MNGSPFKGFYATKADPTVLLDYAHIDRDDETSILFVDGLVAHGHRMFGLPPTEPTYFCKWDFDIGDVLIAAPLEVAEAFGRIGRCLVYSYEDMENSLLIPEPPLYDVTFVSAKISKVKAQFSSEKYILELVTSAIDFRFNDLANERYSERVTLEIPSICTSILDRFPYANKAHSIKATFRTSLIVSNFGQKRNMELCREYQQDHIRLHDAPFHRCAFVLDSKRRKSPEYSVAGVRAGPVPSIPILGVPPPITRDTMPILDPNLGSGDLHRHNLGSDEAASSSASTASRFNESLSNSSTDISLSLSDDDESVRYRPGPGNHGHGLTRRPPYAVDTQKDVANNPFLPARGWKLLEKISADLLTDDDFNLQPTSNYNKGEVASPMSVLDPSTKYENLVIQFGSVEGDVSPFALGAINEIIESMGKEDMETSMDTLQIEFFKRLHMRHVTVLNPEVTNIRLIVPNISIKYGDLEIREESRNVLNLENHIYFDFHGLNLVVRLREQSSVDQMLQAQHSPIKHTVYLNLDNSTIGVRKGGETASNIFEGARENSPVVLQIDRTEFWWHEDQETTGSLRIKAVDSFVMSEQVRWVAEFLDNNIEELKRINVSSTNESNRPKIKKQQQDHNRTAYVLYQLAKAGESFNIQRDPSVLTRPAYIIQSPMHIRASTSWKIIMRLRHILRTVPSEWREYHTEFLLNGSFETPPDIKEQTINIFARWRNWEMTNISSSYVFGYVFMETSLKERLMSVATSTSLDIESIGLRLQYSESEDYLCFDYLKLLFNWSGKQYNEGPDSISPHDSVEEDNNRLLDFESVLSCLHIRSRYSYHLLEVYDSVSDMIFKKNPQEVVKTESTESTAAVESQAKNTPGVLFPMVAMRTSFLLDQLSSVFILPSAELDLQGHQLKLTAFFEQLDPANRIDAAVNVITNCSSFAIALNKRTPLYGTKLSQEKMLQILVNSSVLTYTSYGPMTTCSKYIAARSTEFNVSMEKDLDQQLDFASQLLRHDWRCLREHVKACQNSSEAPIPKKTDPALQYSGNLYIQLNAVHTKLTLRLLPSLSTIYQAENAFIKANHSEKEDFGVAELSIEEQLFRAGSNLADLEAGFELFAFKMSPAVVLIRKEELKGMKDHSLEVLGSVSELSFNTESVAQLLKLAQSGIWQDEAKALETHINNFKKEVCAVTMLGEPPATETVASQKSVKSLKPPLIRLSMTFGKTSMLIPAYGYNAVMEVDGFGIQASSFIRFEDGFAEGFVTRTPLFITTSMDEFKVLIYRKSSEQEKFVFIRLQTAMQLRLSQDGGKKIKHLLSLKSNFTRISFTPVIIQALVEVVSSFSEDMSKYSVHEKGANPATSEIGEPKISDELGRGFVDKFCRNCTASMLVNDVSVAWLFEDRGPTRFTSHPGLLFGYEVLDIQVVSFASHMVLKNVYLAPASERQIFLTKPVTSRTANSALLPNVELRAEFEHEVSLQLAGESLKLTLLPNCVVLVSMFLDSISAAQALIEQSALSADISTVPETPAPVKPLRFPFSWRLNLKFDGAVIELWDEGEFFDTGKVSKPTVKKNSMYSEEGDTTGPEDEDDFRIPSLSLQTPALKAIFEYNSEGNKGSKDRFGCEISITPTSNVIYSRVVPVVVSMTRLVKEVVRANHQFNTARKREKNLLVNKTVRKHSAAGNGPTTEDVELLFSAIDANIMIRFESQELTFSCLPTAKVSATVSVDRWFIGVHSGEVAKQGRIVTAAFSIQNFKASLQHQYSRDVSGYIALEDAMIMLTKGKENTPLESIRVAGKISSIIFDLNMKQMQDLEVFQNIWMPSGTLNTQQVREPRMEIASDPDYGMVMKFRRANTTVAIPWSIDFTIIRIQGYIDMGQSIGKFDCKLDRFWISLQKSLDWEQHLSSGIDLIFLQSHGRLDTTVSLEKPHLRTAIKWDKEVESFTVPLVQAVAGFSAFEVKISLEYHVFAMVYINSVHFAMSNQRDHNKILGDRLIAVGELGTVNFFFTALAASYFVDVVYTFKRLRKASHASYEAILNDSSDKQQTHTNTPKTKRHDRKKLDDEALSNLFSKLRTMFDLRINSLNLYIYPGSFTDSTLFTASLNAAHARFIQEQKDGTLESDLRLNMKSVLVALATSKAAPDLDIGLITVPEFVSFAGQSVRGSTIIFVPVFHVSMRSWQKFGQPVVEYTFTSSIGGRVDIGWNLGSVTFIREMWENHARALAQRQKTYSMTISDSKVIATGADLDKNLKEVELNPVFKYIAREPPDIATPQLRQMGEATPPLEWLGLHRQKFPGLTHQFVIVGLQSLVHNIGKYFVHYEIALLELNEN
ncbi:Csf1p [Sugiyamaella lignohabitans]|uniref:Csf1p n=1 Tax=Sugiyamaella lignohabitans TaxID=796027 RepID=A0A167EYB1_9ASCO|nr:Csf1p [Sugiyamaella lignohabitans]ANB14604.1 Csf1p [Sugiyamaella lignohabitans]